MHMQVKNGRKFHNVKLLIFFSTLAGCFDFKEIIIWQRTQSYLLGYLSWKVKISFTVNNANECKKKKKNNLHRCNYCSRQTFPVLSPKLCRRRKACVTGATTLKCIGLQKECKTEQEVPKYLQWLSLI